MVSEGSPTTYKLAVLVPQRVSIPGHVGKVMDRQTFYEWLWSRFSKASLLGVHEGTVLTEQLTQDGYDGHDTTESEASAEGCEASPEGYSEASAESYSKASAEGYSDPWDIDAAEAPVDRDWIERQEEIRAELYFSEHSQAVSAAKLLKQIPEITVGKVEEQEPQDWDAEWKASFLNSEKGLEVQPFWHIIPPWIDINPALTDASQKRFLKINPGAGFGTGTHETTQLCLESIGRLASKIPLKGARTLDFGSGSGILSIGMALLGAQVDAVEVDALAIENARENASLNNVDRFVNFSQTLPKEVKLYHYVVANILRPVLLEYAERLIQRLHPQGVLILSGLVEKDVELIFNEYSRRIKRSEARVLERGEWRAMIFGG